MLKKILIGVGVAVVGFLGFAATRPDTYRVERSTSVAASPDVAFALVNDFHAWQGWSPWEKLDPAMKKTFEGPATGAGAVYSWVGNNDVGEGKMTIVNAKAPESIEVKLEFIKPFPATSQTLFAFAPNGAETKVTWTMNGTNNFMSKVMTMFMSMDSMIGGDFEKGLKDIKVLAEAEAKKRAEATTVQNTAPVAAPSAP